MFLYVDTFTEPEEFEDFDGDEDMVDLRAYHPVGGIFSFDLLYMPPQPKHISNWIITQGFYLCIFACIHVNIF